MLLSSLDQSLRIGGFAETGIHGPLGKLPSLEGRHFLQRADSLSSNGIDGGDRVHRAAVHARALAMLLTT